MAQVPKETELSVMYRVLSNYAECTMQLLLPDLYRAGKILREMEIEPTTLPFRGSRSTIELHPLVTAECISGSSCGAFMHIMCRTPIPPWMVDHH